MSPAKPALKSRRRLPVVVVGGGGHARVVLSLLSRSKRWKAAGYTDPKAGCLCRAVPGVDWLGGEEALGALRASGVRHAVVGVGSVGPDAAKRKAVFDRLRGLGFEFPVLVSDRACVDETARLGAGTVVMPGAVVNAGAETGENCIINTGALVEHDVRLGDHVHLATGARTAGAVAVENLAHVGIGASVLQGVRIGAGAVVGGGAMVIRDVPGGTTVAGVPAKELKR